MLYKDLIAQFLLIAVTLFFIGCGSDDGASQVSNRNAQKIWSEKERQLILDELHRTNEEVTLQVDKLSVEQWNFRESADRWSILEIIEHLVVQNELHYREIRAIVKTPQLPEYLEFTTGQDDYFRSYATNPQKTQAQWFLEPIGRFCSGENAKEAFIRARHHLAAFVKETDADLRKHLTFRRYIADDQRDAIKPGDVRDLHQLLLTGIAHTDRHLSQIRRIKQNENYP